MSVRRSNDTVGDSVVVGASRRFLARAALTIRSCHVGLLNLASTYTDRWGRKLPDRRSNPTTLQHVPRSNCEELIQDYVQLLAKYERLKEALVEEQTVKATAQSALADLEVAHKVLENDSQEIYNELLKTRRNRDRLRDEVHVLKNHVRSMRRLNSLVRDVYTQMASAYLDGVADERLVKRATKWLER